jgi:two-component system sensor histidine kinase RpfC
LILVATDRHVSDEGVFFRAGYSSLLTSPIDKTLLFNALHGLSTPHQGAGVVSLKDYYERGTLEKRSVDILVAEDNSTNRKIISRILEQAGHRPHLAENGEQALDLLEDHDYDLMILDLNMPIMGGLDVVKIHRALTRNKPRIPVIILTADATIESMQECKAADVDSYLTKPIDALALLDNIAKLTATTTRRVTAPEATSSHMPQSDAEETMLINESTLQQLESLGKDDSFLQTLIHGFVMETEKMLEEMQAALSGQDYVRFKELAHTVKGSSGNIGAEALHRICRDMMDVNTTDMPAAADGLLRQAQDCFKASKVGLIKYLDNSHRVSL